jgi:hypothetical protein
MTITDQQIELTRIQVAAIDFKQAGGMWADTALAEATHHKLATLIDNCSDFNHALMLVVDIIPDFNY